MEDFLALFLSLFEGRRDLQKALAPHSSVLAWQIPWTEEPGGLPSMGSHRLKRLSSSSSSRRDLSLFQHHWEGSQLRERLTKKKDGLFIQQILSACSVSRNS